MLALALFALSAPEPNSGHCHMIANHTTACCAHIENTHFPKFNDHVCLNATAFISPDHSLANSSIGLSLTGNYKEVAEKIYSLAKVGKACTTLPIPGVPGLQACAEFNDLALNTTKLHACADIEIDIVHKHLLTAKLGCFDIPTSKPPA